MADARTAGNPLKMQRAHRLRRSMSPVQLIAAEAATCRVLRARPLRNSTANMSVRLMGHRFPPLGGGFYN